MEQVEMDASIQGNHLNETVFYEQSLVGVVEACGHTRADFLQRQTTNDIRLLSSERVLPTVLTSPTGRILDVLYLVEDQAGNEPGIQALTLPGNAPATTSYLKSRIFFMDQVKVLDTSANYFQIDLTGPNVGQVLERLGFHSIPETGQLLTTQAGAGVLRLFRHDPQLGFGFRICAISELREWIRSSLFEAGVKELSHNNYEILRVEAGLPSIPHELSEEYTPLEVNLESAISDQKGCYTGQEVIARQMTYDKITRKLVGLFLGAEVSLRVQLYAEGKPVGVITSTVLSSRFGPIALSVIKRPYCQPGIELTIDGGENTISARVTQLPFTQYPPISHSKS
jgi:tRNA-modifying protein YgfZ